jgi:hypothetical protein
MFCANRIELHTPAGHTATVTLTALVRSGLPAPRFSVTPFCPAEGYQIDDEDFDLDARHTKLLRLGFSPLEDETTGDVFPASPALLQVECRLSGRDRRIADELAHISLALRFPGELGYTAVAGFDGGLLWCEQFVPAAAGALASSEAVPATVALFVPADPHLLKDVQASFTPRPDGKARYRAADYPGTWWYGRPWPCPPAAP